MSHEPDAGPVVDTPACTSAVPPRRSRVLGSDLTRQAWQSGYLGAVFTTRAVDEAVIDHWLECPCPMCAEASAGARRARTRVLIRALADAVEHAREAVDTTILFAVEVRCPQFHWARPQERRRTTKLVILEARVTTPPTVTCIRVAGEVFDYPFESEMTALVQKRWAGEDECSEEDA